jgi:hypothetical protein
MPSASAIFASRRVTACVAGTYRPETGWGFAQSDWNFHSNHRNGVCIRQKVLRCAESGEEPHFYSIIESDTFAG